MAKTKCQEFVDALDETDLDNFLTAEEAYRGAGAKPADSARKAVADIIAQVGTEKADIEALIAEQAPTPAPAEEAPPAVSVAPTEVLEPEPTPEPEPKAAVAEAAVPTSPQEQRQLHGELRERLDSLGLKDIGLKTFSAPLRVQVGERKVESRGSYINSIIKISLAYDEPQQAVDHEAIHALKAMDAFKNAEWQVITRAAESSWIEEYNIEKKYEGLSRDEMVEEAFGNAFSAWRAGDLQAGGRLKAVFERMANILRSIKDFLAGKGITSFQTWENIFKDIEAGEKGPRAPAREGEEEKAMVAGPAGDHEKTISRIMGTTDKNFWQRARERIADYRERENLKVKQGFLDQFAAIEWMEKANYGKPLDASLSPFKAAHATQNLMSVMGAVLNYGPLKLEAGWFVLDEDFGGGFESIFEELAKSDKLRLWKGWAIAKRSKRLMTEGREHLLTESEIEELLPLGDEHPEFQQVFDRWTQFNTRMLDMVEASGLINKEQRSIWEKSDYIPFYRIMEDAETVKGARKGRKGLEGQRSGIRTLTGGEAQINDPLENMVMSMTSLVDRSFKNLAMRKVTALARQTGAMEEVGPAWRPALIPAAEAVKKLKELGIEVGSLSTEERTQIVKMFQMTAPQDPDIVSVMIKGKPVYYRVKDPLLLSAISSLSPQQLGEVMKILRASKRLLTMGVTIDPAFMLANFMRDTVSSWVVTGQKGFKPGIDSVRGFAKALKGDTVLGQIMASGGGSGGFYRTDPEDVRKLMDARTRGLDKKRVLDSPKKLWEFWQKVGQASEAANRIAIYEAAIKAGETKAEAAYRARDVMDFAMRGDFAVMRFLAETVPFLNARVQGLYRLYRGGRDNPKAFLLRGSMVMAASLAVMAMNWDRPEYDELEDWDKDTYYHFWIEGQHFRLPKPFEVGAIFSTIPERMVRLMSKKDDGKKAVKRLLAMFMDTFAMNPIPQLFKPVVEQWANEVSFTGRPIVGQGLDRLRPEAQWSSWTSEAARALGKAMPEVMGEARSPKRIEHLVRGYLGALGTYLLTAADSAVRLFGDYPTKPTRRIDDIPVVKRFVKADPPRSTVYLTDFYELRRETSRLTNTLREYRRQGAADEAIALLGEKRRKARMGKFIERTAMKLSKINRTIRLTETNKSMSADAKRSRIDRLIDRKNTLARAAMMRVSRIEKYAQ